MSTESARYELPLAKPLRLGSTTVETRCGYLVRNGGQLGDACPLPSFSPDSLETVAAALLGGGSTESLSWARHALPLEGDATVRTAGLVVAAADAGPPQSPCVKLKVGRLPLAEELEAIARFKSAGVTLRLDGNRALSLDDAARLFDAGGDAVEFLEEPVAARDLDAAMARMPIALDETLLEGGPPPSGAAAFVLKPTVLGAPRTLELVQHAQARDLPVVISSSYESAVGRAALIRFAASVAPQIVHGLGTGPAFAEDFVGWVEEDGDRLSAQDGDLPEGLEWVTC